MSQTVRVRYSAGGWLGLVRGRCLVALPADASEETAAVTWDLLTGTPGVERLLATVLSGRLDLTGLPSFAIVSFRQGASVHAILRGEVTLRMKTADGGLTELHGTGVATWNERVFHDIDSFEMLVEGAVSDVENLPLESGAVRLGSLFADLQKEAAETDPQPERALEPEPEPEPEAEAVAVAVAVAEPEPEPEVEVEDESDTEQESEGEQEPEPEIEPELELEPEAEPETEAEPDVDPEDEAEVTDQDATMAPDSAQEPADPTPADPTPAGPSTADPEDEVDDQTVVSPTDPAATAAPATAPAPTAAVPGPQELIDSVPWLAAARRPVPAPAAAPAQEEHQLVEMPADLNMTVAPETAFEDSTVDADEADDADTVLSPAAPVAETSPASGPAASVPAPPAPLGDEDHDGETVMKSDLDPADLPAEPPAPAPAAPPATGPVVLARECSQGHANPPTSSTCGLCGQSLGGEAQQVRRPSLGRLRMSTGEVVELDRPAVIGRQPQAHRVGSGTMPRMVQVRSPNGDISRSHCEVVLEGWHVQLRDLKATNGTVLIREGQPPRRLGQGESIMVLDGDIADLGDGVSLRFEGLL